jgi:hypothetical protein
MSTQSLVFLKQLVDNADYANETGVLNVIALLKDPDPQVTQGTSYAAGAFDTLVRLLELRPDLLTPAVAGQLEALAEDPDQRVSSTAKAALETASPEATVATPDLAGAVPERTRPASARTSSLAEVRQQLEADVAARRLWSFGNAVSEYLKKQFAPPEYPYWYFLTPGELCDAVECYADRLIVSWNENDRRLSAKSDVFVQLQWMAHPKRDSITLVGLYAFDSPREAREVWFNKGVYPEDMPVDRVLDVRGPFALNFQSGNYAWAPDDLDEISPDELWPRIWRYCQAVGAPIDV